MRTEITNAVNFLSNLIRSKDTSPDQLDAFREALASRFALSFTGHWFPEKPLRGNAYRCVRIVSNRMDRLVAAAGEEAGLSEAYLLAALPRELSVWIDPDEVSYRFGEDGSVGVIYSALEELVKKELKEKADAEIALCTARGFRPSSSGSLSSSSSSPVSSTSSSPTRGMLTDSAPSSPSSTLRVSPDTVNGAYLLQDC